MLEPSRLDIFILLPMVAVLIDFLTPFLVWKGLLPAPVRFIAHGAMAAMIGVIYVRMMTADHFPLALWVILGGSLFGISTALGHGQNAVATLWGGWLMFQFPLAGLFAYLQPYWPRRFPQLVGPGLLVALLIVLGTQLGQYVTGETVGDNLGGLFGPHGTSSLILFILLTLSIALGDWVKTGTIWQLLLVLIAGGLSSVLGEMKLFVIVAPILLLVAQALRLRRIEQLWQLIVLAALIVALIQAYSALYTIFVPTAEQQSLLTLLEDPQALERYLGSAGMTADAQGVRQYDIGRNAALALGWQTISQDPLTMAVGMGLGARGESKTLGTAGQALASSAYGLTTGTSLLVMLQEIGLGGMLVVFGFFVWAITRMARDMRRQPASPANGLRYGLIIFTLLWPIWLWYSTAWTMRLPMLIYWILLGYVMAEGSRPLRGRRWPFGEARPRGVGEETVS